MGWICLGPVCVHVRGSGGFQIFVKLFTPVFRCSKTSFRLCLLDPVYNSEVARTNSSEADGYDLMLRLRPAEVVESQLLLGGSGKN